VSSELPARLNTKEHLVAVLIPLLILHLALLSLQIEDRSGTLLFKTWTLAVQAPVLSVSSAFARAVSRFCHNYIWMVGARRENERLQDAVHKLSLLNSSYEQIRQENLRLRKLIALSEILPNEMLGARVIARTPSFFANVVYIDRGWQDGVRADAAVVSGDGVVGRIVLASRNQAQVQLITNPDASVGVMLANSRTPGVLRGSGDYLLDLNYIGNTEQVAVGDIVLSSGLDGIYPKGLAIGKVIESRKGKGVFRTIKVQPDVDLARLEEVQILLGQTKPQPEQMQQKEAQQK
jgi:rod shape-determining protein MreC